MRKNKYKRYYNEASDLIQERDILKHTPSTHYFLSTFSITPKNRFNVLLIFIKEVEKITSEKVDDINKHPLEELAGVPKLTDLQRTKIENQSYIWLT